jgi:hypothetical protein
VRSACGGPRRLSRSVGQTKFEIRATTALEFTEDSNHVTNSGSLKLSLLENSHSFLKEAVSKAVAAISDTRQWQFAILNVVQSLELSLKAALNAIHPALVYENIDNPKNTIGPLTALQRLASPKIGGLTFSEDDRRRIQHAVDVRNQMTHADFELTSEYAAAKFFEMFAFVADFQRRHLGTAVSTFLPISEYESLVQIRKLLDELVLRAEARIAEEQISEEWIWSCPNCGEQTFVIDGDGSCYACGHSEEVIECPHCSQIRFEYEMESFFDQLDPAYKEGRAVVYNSYGYHEYTACPDCSPRIKQDIQNQRQEEEFQLLEDEYRARLRSR